MNLTEKKCIPCEGVIPAFSEKRAMAFLKETKGFELEFGPPMHISKTFKFKNFKEVMGFLVKVGMLAEEEGHHPDIEAHYNKVILSLHTHAINGLSENDFIVAAKINQL